MVGELTPGFPWRGKGRRAGVTLKVKEGKNDVSVAEDRCRRINSSDLHNVLN